MNKCTNFRMNIPSFQLYISYCSKIPRFSISASIQNFPPTLTTYCSTIGRTMKPTVLRLILSLFLRKWITSRTDPPYRHAFYRRIRVMNFCWSSLRRSGSSFGWYTNLVSWELFGGFYGVFVWVGNIRQFGCGNLNYKFVNIYYI